MSLQSQIPNVLSIAKLLSDCAVLPESELSTIVANAARESITVGKYLHLNKLVRPQVIRAAILCHFLLSRKLILYTMVIEALKLVVNDNLTIELALTSLHWNRVYFEHLLQLRKLLEDSGLVKSDELNLAYDICLRDQQPLLFVLVKRDTLSDVTADRVLLLHEKLTRSECTVEEAVMELEVPQSNSVAGGAICDAVVRNLRLGEILIAADLVGSVELIAAVEKGRAERLPFGQILVRDYGISSDVIDQAVFVQSLINSGFVSIYDGIQRLSSGKSPSKQ